MSWEQKFKLDVWYVENQSLWLDIKILLKTLNVVIFRKNVNDQSGHSMPRFLGDTEKNKMNTSVTCTLVEIDHEWDNKIQAFDFDIITCLVGSNRLHSLIKVNPRIDYYLKKPCYFLSLFVD
nr:sugar transferase [Pasteurella multocida]